MAFNPNQIPNEYEVKDGTASVRMVLQTDYAKLKSAYMELHLALESIKMTLMESSRGL